MLTDLRPAPAMEMTACMPSLPVIVQLYESRLIFPGRSTAFHCISVKFEAQSSAQATVQHNDGH